MKNFQFRKIVLAIADFLIIIEAGHISLYIMHLLNIDPFPNHNFNYIPFLDLPFGIILNATICCSSLIIFGAYSKMWRHFNRRDYMSCILGILPGLLISSILQASIKQTPSLLFVLLNYIIATIGIVFFRFLFRNTFLNFSKGDVKPGTRTLIVGAGKATRIILKEIKNSNEDSNTNFEKVNPVALVDDDTGKRGVQIYGVEVIGTTKDIPAIVKSYNIENIIVCMPSATSNEHKRVLDICYKTGCKTKIVPYLSQLIFDEGQTIINQITDIKIEDLLGREPISFDKDDVKKLLRGKVCMVTGGGGSIGGELVRQIAKYSPKKVLIVDIYENNAYDVQQELIMEYGDKSPSVPIIASVRDYNKIEKLFAEYKPNIVFHAAAHKHVPLMESAPEEAVKNNILGTYNVATLAENYGAEKFIMISTDKAVNPTNVMGATKRCCEMIIQHKAQNSTKTEFVTTRFGNVLGSNGSVIPLFKRQIDAGKPVTVTHPEVTRYFMTIPEAVSLVLQAGAMAKGGEIFVLDMGEPVKIVTLAENLIKLYGKEPNKDIKIKFTGLRPGEKLYEELLMDEEGLTATNNKKIFIGNHINVDSEELLAKLDVLFKHTKENNSEMIVELLQDLVPTYKK